MKITDFKTGVISLPREDGPLTGGFGPEAQFVTIKIRTDNGLEGIGYSGFASNLMLKALKESVDALLEQIKGSDPQNNESINTDSRGRSARRISDASYFRNRRRTLGYKRQIDQSTNIQIIGRIQGQSTDIC